jgi:hypothetical protein
MLHVDANTKFESKNLCDLLTNTREVNEILFALRMVKSAAAHKFTRRKQGISHLILVITIYFIVMLTIICFLSYISNNSLKFFR